MENYKSILQNSYKITVFKTRFSVYFSCLSLKVDLALIETQNRGWVICINYSREEKRSERKSFRMYSEFPLLIAQDTDVINNFNIFDNT